MNIEGTNLLSYNEVLYLFYGRGYSLFPISPTMDDIHSFEETGERIKDIIEKESGVRPLINHISQITSIDFLIKSHELLCSREYFPKIFPKMTQTQFFQSESRLKDKVSGMPPGGENTGVLYLSMLDSDSLEIEELKEVTIVVIAEYETGWAINTKNKQESYITFPSVYVFDAEHYGNINEEDNDSLCILGISKGLCYKRKQKNVDMYAPGSTLSIPRMYELRIPQNLKNSIIIPVCGMMSGNFHLITNHEPDDIFSKPTKRLEIYFPGD